VIECNQSGTGVVTYNASGGIVRLACSADTDKFATTRVNSNGGALYFTTCTIDTLELTAGTVRVADSVILNGSNVRIYGGDIEVSYKASDTPIVTQTGGTFYTERAMSTFNFRGGTARVNVRQVATGATTVNVFGSGTLTWQRGDITTLNAEAAANAIVDFSQVTEPITITSAVVGPLLTVRSSPLVTVTNTYLRGQRTQFGN
jgi:hypothetical protein